MSRFRCGLFVFAIIACASSIVIQKHRLFSGKLFPSINNDVRILRIVLHAESVSAIYSIIPYLNRDMEKFIKRKRRKEGVYGKAKKGNRPEAV